MYGAGKTGNKNIWVLFLLLLAGIVLGGFIGEYLGNISYMSWLKYGQEFGIIDTPVALKLGILDFYFAFNIKLTISGIIGIVISIFVYKRL